MFSFPTPAYAEARGISFPPNPAAIDDARLADVATLRRQYVRAQPGSDARLGMLVGAGAANSAVARALAPMLARNAAGEPLLSEWQQRQVRCLVLLPEADIVVDQLRCAGLDYDAALDLCELLRDAPDGILMQTLRDLAVCASPLTRWWHNAPQLADDARACVERRDLRILQLVGFREWPHDEGIWRQVISHASEALRRDRRTGEPMSPRNGRALLGLLPIRRQTQDAMILSTNEPLLLHAMRHGLPGPAVKQMLETGFCADVASPAGNGEPSDRIPLLCGARPLHYAAIHGDIEAITALAYHGADINARDAFGCTPVLYANARDTCFAKAMARTDRELRDRTVAVVWTLRDLGANTQVRGAHVGSLGAVLIGAVIESRDGGGMTTWPAFEQLMWALHEDGVSFEMPAGWPVDDTPARQVAAFARAFAADNPEDASWALSALLARLAVR